MGFQRQTFLTRYFSTLKEVPSAIEAINEARSLQEQRNHKDTLEYYKIVYTCYSGSILAPEAFHQTGQIRTEKHEYLKAFKAHPTIITDYPRYLKV